MGELLRDTWLGELGIDYGRLAEEGRIQVEFIFAGLVGVLGSAEAAESPLVMASLANSSVGSASVASLEKMAAAQAGEQPL